VSAPASGSGFWAADFGTPPERGFQPRITRALEWVVSIAGRLQAFDGGAALDRYDTTLTYRLHRGAVDGLVSAELAQRTSNGTGDTGAAASFYAPSGVWPFGPLINCSAGVPVAIMGVEWDARPDVVAQVWPVRLQLRYLGGFAPTMRSVPSFLARGVPVERARRVDRYVCHPTEGGGAVMLSRGLQRRRSVTLRLDCLTQSEGQHLAEWAAWLRAGTFAYTPPAGLHPFGVDYLAAGANGPYTCRLRDVRWLCPYPQHWTAEVDLALEES
jgi:hypothetical protein